MDARQSHCPDCQGELELIKLVDATNDPWGVPNEKSPAGHHIQLQYTAIDAKRSTWTKRFPTSGHVCGLMCTQCGRVLLYAEPARDQG